VRMDGEHGGEIVVLDAATRATSPGIRRSGTTVPSSRSPTTDVTRRRGHHPRHRPWRRPHFLLKEIVEAPESFRKTLRGKIVERDGRLRAACRRPSAATVDRRPPRRPLDHPGPVIGQGTAAVAGRRARGAARRAAAVRARHRRDHRPPSCRVRDAARHARHPGDRRQPERHDHRHQPHRRPAAGARRRGDRHRQPPRQRPGRQGRRRPVHVRRSRRRDERRVHQGVLRAGRRRRPARLRDRRGEPGWATDRRRHDLLTALRELPDALRRGAGPARRDRRGGHRRFARTKRYWAVVGNGPNRVAAEEVRIKLSELCYKSISCDVTEDKKHIDLSSEPLILVCAAGLRGSTADDVAKETAIFRRTRRRRSWSPTRARRAIRAAATIHVPPSTRRWASCCRRWSGTCSATRPRSRSTPRAAPARGARGDRAVVAERPHRRNRRRCSAELVRTRALPRRAPRPPLRRPAGGQHGGAPRRAAARPPVAQPGRGVPAPRPARSAPRAALIDELAAALTKAIEELTRPIDAIKHQAKTVTVGISAATRACSTGCSCRPPSGRRRPRCAQLPHAQGARRPRPAVIEVTGFTRYAIDGARSR
jgi:glutamine---fructose-6-phosphate transaminase (isomerizing)